MVVAGPHVMRQAIPVVLLNHSNNRTSCCVCVCVHVVVSLSFACTDLKRTDMRYTRVPCSGVFPHVHVHVPFPCSLFSVFSKWLAPRVLLRSGKQQQSIDVQQPQDTQLIAEAANDCCRWSLDASGSACHARLHISTLSLVSVQTLTRKTTLLHSAIHEALAGLTAGNMTFTTSISKSADNECLVPLS